MTALDLVGAPRRTHAPPYDFACPTDGSSLHWDETGLACRQCGRSWDRQGDVPLFMKSDDPDESLLSVARSDGWEKAAPGRVPAEELDPSRADWRFLLPLSESSRVLEIGAGWGSVTMAVAPEVESIVATTQDPTQARFLEIRARQAGLDNVVPAVAPAVYLPFAAGAFDLVILNDLLSRSGERGDRKRRREAQRNALRAVREKLSPKGLLWLQAGNRFGRPDILGPWKGLLDRRGTDFTCGLDGYRNLLKDAGFARVDFYAPLPNARRPKELLPLGDTTVADFWVERSLPRASAHAKVLKWAFHVGILPRLVPTFGIVAQ